MLLNKKQKRRLIVLLVLLALTAVYLVYNNQRTMPVMSDGWVFLALNDAKLCSKDLLATHLRVLLPGSTVEIDDLKVTEPSYRVVLDGHPCVVGLIDSPMPWDELETACAGSWLWHKASDIMRRHSAHLVVSVSPENQSRIQRTLLLTRLAAACARAHNARGIYWRDARLVHEPKTFFDMTHQASTNALPTLLWINFRMDQNQNGAMNLYTIGLAAFDCMEIEVIHADTTLEDLLDMAKGVAHLLLRGERISHGDVISLVDRPAVKVTHENSRLDRPDKVLRLHI